MIIPVSWIAYTNLAVLVLVAVFLLIGLYKGFLMMAVEFFSLIVTFVISYFIAPMLASRFDLASHLNISIHIPMMQDLIMTRINGLIWFLIVFVVLMVVFAILRGVVKMVSEVPLIREVNAILGGLFGLLKSYALLLLLIFVLTSPFIKNGNIVLNQTVLGKIYVVSADIFTWFREPAQFNEMLSDIMNNKTIQQADLQKFMDWLQSNTVSNDQITQLIEQIHIEEGE